MVDPRFPTVTVVDHPLVLHKLTLLRRRDTSTAKFRQVVREISLLMAYEITRDLPLCDITIETPLEQTQAPALLGKKLCFVPILRAGVGILDGMLDLVPSARVGHIGLYRNPETLDAVEYYCKLPDDLPERLILLVDPMLATGHSASAALSRLREAGAVQMRLLCLLAAPEGLAVVQGQHPDVSIYTAAIDRGLDEHGYIRPGLGDAGDRLFGTK